MNDLSTWKAELGKALGVALRVRDGALVADHWPADLHERFERAGWRRLEWTVTETDFGTVGTYRQGERLIAVHEDASPLRRSLVITPI